MPNRYGYVIIEDVILDIYDIYLKGDRFFIKASGIVKPREFNQQAACRIYDRDGTLVMDVPARGDYDPVFVSDHIEFELPIRVNSIERTYD